MITFTSRVLEVRWEVSNENVCVTKNDHFFKLCPGGQLKSHVNEEKCVFALQYPIPS